jgi:hypothetical protein
MVMMNMVNELYHNGEIEWVYNKKGELKKENFDACDSLICALAYVNINHHGLDTIKIEDAKYFTTTESSEVRIEYKTKIWDKVYDKVLIIENSKK